MITTTWIGTKVCPACRDPIQLGPLDAPPFPMETTWMIYGSHKKEGGRDGPWPLKVFYTRVVLPDGRLCCDAKCAAKTLELDSMPPEKREAEAAEWRANYRLHGLGEYGDKVSVGAWIKGPSRSVQTTVIGAAPSPESTSNQNMTEKCSKSPDGYHCDHEQGQAHYTAPKNMQCCYCGRDRIEPPRPLGGNTYTHTKHGPFHTPPRAMY